MIVLVQKCDILLHVSMEVLERKCKPASATCTYGGSGKKFVITTGTYEGSSTKYKIVLHVSTAVVVRKCEIIIHVVIEILAKNVR